MEISENWLREWADPAVDTETLVFQLTMAGLEVEGTRAAAPGLVDVVVAEVVTADRHPDADKLNLCRVNDGVDELQVVCGAANLRAGLKVAFARIGATLPGIKIKQAKLRGVDSAGMICSATELQLAETSSGILELAEDAPVGMPIVEYLALNDTIIEIDLTPNRGDCLSIAGVAREVSAINRVELKTAAITPVEPTITDTLTVELEAPEHCPRYVGRVIRGIDPAATTPLWMREKLRRCGLRPISPVVDITNYVMMELGQPMHGFDCDKLAGGIRVRLAEPGEKLSLLDDSEVECRDDTLLIADHKGGVALAGIMGGLDSSVQAGTRNIFLEAAHFTAIELAGKARAFGMHTDASHRFERGVDATLPPRAMERATRLLLDIAGGDAGPIIDAVNVELLPSAPVVELRHERVERLLGIDVPRQQTADILDRLGMGLETTATGWNITPPSYRYDINIEPDLIEEVGRLIGYNNIPGTRESSHIAMDSFSEQRVDINRVRDALVGQGFFEAVTYSFVAPELQALLDPEQETLPLQNPLSAEMSVMRTRLLPGLVQALRHNLHRQQNRVRLFEAGLCFVPSPKGLVQVNHIAGVITGGRHREGLYSAGEGADFFDIKGSLESILELGNIDAFNFARSNNPVLHPGQGADLMHRGEILGFAGALHPALLKKLDLSQPVFAFECELSPILGSILPKFREMSRFPSIRRDIAVTVDADVPVQRLIDSTYSVNNQILQDVFVFDVYTGKEVRNNRKSVALGLILQDFSRTLVDEDVENLVEKVLIQLKQDTNAVLRES